MSKEKEIFRHLYDLGVCKTCCLRYICVRNSDVYKNIDKYIKEKQFLPETINKTDDQQSKKLKTNPCLVCLGLLEENCLNSIVDKIAESNVKNYDCDYFTCSVSYPACIQIREKSLRIHLEKIYPEFYTFETQETLLNKTWKWTIKSKIAQKINKNFENSDTCNFSINILTAYENDSQECQQLIKMAPNYFATRQKQTRKFKGELFSRKSITDFLNTIKKGVFTEFAHVPPSIPDKYINCESVECFHNSIYFAGRYNKYSRNLPQSPWILNGVRMLESSVQEKIFEPVIQHFNLRENSIKFSSSGREDVDVRCLGKGRPFYLEISNPTITKISDKTFRQIEQQINNNTTDIQIKHLQMVTKDEVHLVKAGEESKTKEYEAICFFTDNTTLITNDFIDRLNQWAPVTLKQKTPLRVLHRRPLSVREKSIYELKAEKMTDKVFKVKVKTQAGTYVKEFIHGDFGRTEPNLDSFSGNKELVDILALDVTAINLDWPKPVEYD